MMKKKKNILIGILCCALVFMGIGYATLRQLLNIKSTANVTGSFNIIIDDLNPIQESGAKCKETDVPKDATASYISEFHKPGEYIRYKVIVKNLGEIKGVLKGVTVTQTVEDNDPMKNILELNNKKLDDVFITEVFGMDNDNNTLNLDDVLGKEISTNEEHYFEIKTSLNSEIDFIPKGSMKTVVRIEYEQPKNKNNETPGGEIVDDYNEADIVVDDEGLLTRINIDKYTENGTLKLPAVASDGRAIISIDRNSFLKYNVMQFCDEDKSTGNDSCGVIINDEQHFDEIKEIIENSNYGSGYYSSGYDDSGYYSSNNLLGDVKPSKLINKNGDKPLIKRLSWYQSGRGTHDIQFYRPGEKSLSEKAEKNVFYVDIVTKKLSIPTNQIKSLDLTGATNLTTIKEYAFYNSQLSNINFSNSIIKIEKLAFSNAGLGGKLELPSLLETIDADAFSFNSINELIITSKITTMGDYAFQSNQIVSLSIENAITIGNHAFESNQIEKLKIPDSIETIGQNAFIDNKIESLYIGKGLKTIGWYVFGYNQIKQLTIPSTVTTIESNAFVYNQISELTILSDETWVEPYAFANQNYDQSTGEYSGFSKVTIAKSFPNMFGSDSKISELSIGTGNINDYEFQHFEITKLTLGGGVSEIGSGAFINNKISELTIPSSVTSIGDMAFYYQKFNMHGYTYAGINKVTFEKYISGMSSAFEIISELIIESGNIENFEFDDIGITKLTLGGGVSEIGREAFINNKISELTIPSSVTSIGDKAFYYQNFNMNDYTCAEINKVTFEKYISGMASAFGKISELIIESGNIEDSAFDNMGITKLTLGEGVTEIGSGAFKLNLIEEIVLSPSITTIRDNAFSNNLIAGELDLSYLENLTSLSGFSSNLIEKIVLPPNITTIGDYAFSDNPIVEFEIPDNVETIGKFAFMNNQIKELTIPSTVNSLGVGAFYGFSYEKVKIQKLNSNFGYVFRNSSRYVYMNLNGGSYIPELIIESGEIGFADFLGMHITNLTLGSGVTSIDSNAFLDNQLNIITIKRTEQDFNDNVTIGGTWYEGNPQIKYQT